MAISIGDIQVQLSGGAANTAVISSLGGAISTAAGGANLVISQDNGTGGAITTTIFTTAVADIVNAFGNPEGNGSLQWDQTGSNLLWRPNGSVSYVGANITGNGLYTIGDTNGYLIVNVKDYATLSGIASATDNNVAVYNATENTFDNVSALESLNGSTEYRCFYIKNEHATDPAYDVRVWIKSQPTGPDTLEIALDPGGVNATALGPLNDESDSTNILSGITWSNVSTQATGLTMGTLTAGSYYAFWIKRVVAPETTQKEPNDVSAIGLSALI